MTWSVNRAAAKTVALHAGGTPASRRELLDELGLVGHDGLITADDTREIELPQVNESSAVERSKVNVREPNMDRSLVPPGLRDLLPHAEQPKRKTVNRDKCGTLTGARQHVRNGEKACQACKDVRNAYSRERRKRINEAVANGTPLQPSRTGRPSLDVLPPTPEKCGSMAGRSSHYRRGEEVCRECKDAYNSHQRGRRRRRSSVVDLPEAQSA